jgi:hypothetical protein
MEIGIVPRARGRRKAGIIICQGRRNAAEQQEMYCA